MYKAYRARSHICIDHLKMMTGNMWLLTCSIFNFIVLKIRVAELLKQNYDENSRLSVMAVTMWTYSCRETCFILNVFWNYNALRTGVDKHLELPHQVSPTLATLLFLSQLKKKKNSSFCVICQHHRMSTACVHLSSRLLRHCLIDYLQELRQATQP